MEVGELLKTVEFAPVWEYLVSYYPNACTYEGYQHAFHELNNTVPVKPAVAMEVFVEKIYDENDPEGYYFDIYGVQSGDSTHCSLKFSPWEELLSYQVSLESIEKYGLIAVTAHILYDMTWFGGTSEAVAKFCKELEEPDEVYGPFYSLAEMEESLDLDD
ncbi:hypothetical protein LJC74_05090 [Eubacteriales bacterium OttesenSCG-928-A19]|nr:hypothetical protein [Eubacteriales bacterium OttesenSCG-928-A19]